MAGIPGRPGNGLVGSTWGAAGLPEQKPSASPDDHYWANSDLFCSDLAGMADGILIVGGIDWYNEPDVLSKHRGDPAYVGLVELGGLKTTRIFDPKTSRFSDVSPYRRNWFVPSKIPIGPRACRRSATGTRPAGRLPWSSPRCQRGSGGRPR